MTFGRPELLWLALAALPVLILHLVRRRRRRETVASLLLWDEVLAKAARRIGLRALAGLLSLLLVLAAVGVGTLAAADARIGRPRPPARPLVLVVGGSARMEGNRFEEARRIVGEELAAKAPHDPVTLVLASARPRLLALRETDPERVLSALAAARPVLEPADWAAAGDAMAEALAAGSRVVAIGVAPEAPSGAAVRSVGGGSAGIVRFAVRVGADEVRVLAGAAGELPGREFVLTQDGEEIAREPAGPEVLFTLPRRGGRVRVRIEPAAGPAFDDEAEAVVPAPVRLRVGVVADGGPDPFLAAALGVVGPVVDEEASGIVPPDRAAEAREVFDVLVAAGAAPDPLPAGDWILLGPPPAGLGFRPAPAVAASALWEEADHPVTRGVDTAEVTALGAVPATCPAGATPLLSLPGGAIAAAGEREGARYVWIGLGPGDSTLPVTGAYPLLLRNALRWFADLREAPLPPEVRAGDALRPAVDLPPGVATVAIAAPGGDGPVLVPVRDGRFSFPTREDEEGPLRVRIGDREIVVPANVLLPGETAARPVADSGPRAPLRAGFRDTERRLAPWLAAAAAFLLVLEWALGRWVRDG